MAGRRGNREGSIYKRKDGRWVGAVTEAPGKRSLVYGTTRRDVQSELGKMLKAQEDGLPIPGKRLTVEQYLTRYLDESARQTLRPQTLLRYQQLVRKHAFPALGRIPLAKLTPRDLKQPLRRQAARGPLAAYRPVPARDPAQGSQTGGAVGAGCAQSREPRHVSAPNPP